MLWLEVGNDSVAWTLCYPERIQTTLKSDFVPWKALQIFALGSSSAVSLAARSSPVCSLRRLHSLLCSEMGSRCWGRRRGLWSHPFFHVGAEHDPPVFSLEELLGLNALSLHVHRDSAGGCLNSDP